ncbi:hypothetical protein H6G00_00825 [Leptolyngbya sp. FACHB-541]|uniref:hypothetical protein n=1 Tax=Leptolyngbya sp. FACHB-541 TaxID=2692810 RepID=UPI001683B052|nr:hypothetical protein [Leptolyngbya sp. FACHB-541]MBD1995171.1 hypothetical protein [Leptolyngbya sp. FACHB-541]
MVKEYPHNAPKDGSLLLLRVKVTEDCEHRLEDEEIFTTIGFNNLANTGDDKWQLVGWNWCGDCFTELDGDFEILGWAEIPEILVRGGDRQ